MQQYLCTQGCCIFLYKYDIHVTLYSMFNLNVYLLFSSFNTSILLLSADNQYWSLDFLHLCLPFCLAMFTTVCLRFPPFWSSRLHSRVPKIHFFTTPLGYSPPWGEVSPAVIILSLLVMRLKTSLSYRQGLKRPKHQAERWDFKSHSLRHSSNTDLPLGVQVSAFIWQPCKTVVATYVLKIMPVTSLKPLRQEIPIYNIYFGDNLVSKQPSNPFSGIACQSNGVCNALQSSLSFSVTHRFFRLLWLFVLLFHLFHINNASASDNIKRNSFCEPGGCVFPFLNRKDLSSSKHKGFHVVPLADKFCPEIY